MSVVVTDAGPLIHLNEIGCLSLLRIFETVHVPDAVWFESVRAGRVLDTAILSLGRIRRHALPLGQIEQFVSQNNLMHLQAGEKESLCLCREIGVLILLTDDLAVREAAKRLGLKPVGSLGVVVRAYHMGHCSLSKAERYLTDLYDVSSLFVARAIVELAIEQLHERLQ